MSKWCNWQTRSPEKAVFVGSNPTLDTMAPYPNLAEEAGSEPVNVSVRIREGLPSLGSWDKVNWHSRSPQERVPLRVRISPSLPRCAPVTDGEVSRLQPDYLAFESSLGCQVKRWKAKWRSRLIATQALAGSTPAQRSTEGTGVWTPTRLETSGSFGMAVRIGYPPPQSGEMAEPGLMRWS